MQPRFRYLRAVPLFAIVVLGGCTLNQDPNDYPGTWHPTAVNEYNLRLMVAEPADLTRGHGALDSRGQTSAGAIGRMRNDKIKPLPASESFTVGGSASATPTAQP